MKVIRSLFRLFRYKSMWYVISAILAVMGTYSACDDNSAGHTRPIRSCPDDMQGYLPSVKSGVAEQLLFRKAYVVSYNNRTKIPNWVAWHLTGERCDGEVPRQKTFVEDTQVTVPRPTLADYKRSGYDRGHMCPAGDNKWDKTAMYESFYLTNICPQDPDMNSGIWNYFEQQCRYWAKQHGDLYIVCGPLFLRQESHKTIGENEIFVPEAFFKVILQMSDQPRGAGIILRNISGQTKSDIILYSIDEIEDVTDIDFFPDLPDNTENVIESKVDYSFWKINNKIFEKREE